jgi:hypothetical protein
MSIKCSGNQVLSPRPLRADSEGNFVPSRAEKSGARTLPRVRVTADDRPSFFCDISGSPDSLPAGDSSSTSTGPGGHSEGPARPGHSRSVRRRGPGRGAGYLKRPGGRRAVLSYCHALILTDDDASEAGPPGSPAQPARRGRCTWPRPRRPPRRAGGPRLRRSLRVTQAGQSGSESESNHVTALKRLPNRLARIRRG